jgi:hypothetical protein
MGFAKESRARHEYRRDSTEQHAKPTLSELQNIAPKTTAYVTEVITRL